MKNDKIEIKFLKSVFSLDSCHVSTNEIISWLKEQNNKVSVSVNKINFKSLINWSFNNEKISHNSGGFFSIEGLNIKTNWGNISEWDQPVINQPEVGYLGFIVKEINGVFHFLTQAKIEPGNVNYVQLSPTLQATRSNYTQKHKGKKPIYLEYFQKAKSNQILLDQLQSEQGARFLRKRNRNIIIKVDEDIPVYDNFIWLTLGQLKKLMQYDNLVNMDTRTVVSGIPFGNFSNDFLDFISFLNPNQNKYHLALLKSALSNDSSLHTIKNIISLITQFKSNYDLNITKIPLSKMNKWVVENDQIIHITKKYFKVIAVDVKISNREVVNWTQPMLQPTHEGLCAFVCKEINGILHFAVQNKLECGNHDIIELAPTVQTLTGNYKDTKKGELPFLEYVLEAKKEQIIFDTVQSEEGGRFYREQNRNMIVIGGDDVPTNLPKNFIWMTLNQLYVFLKFNNYLNIQARNLISTISFI